MNPCLRQAIQTKTQKQKNNKWLGEKDYEISPTHMHLYAPINKKPILIDVKDKKFFYSKLPSHVILQNKRAKI